GARGVAGAVRCRWWARWRDGARRRASRRESVAEQRATAALERRSAAALERRSAAAYERRSAAACERRSAADARRAVDAARAAPRVHARATEHARAIATTTAWKHECGCVEPTAQLDARRTKRPQDVDRRCGNPPRRRPRRDHRCDVRTRRARKVASSFTN